MGRRGRGSRDGEVRVVYESRQFRAEVDVRRGGLLTVNGLDLKRLAFGPSR